MMAKDAIETLVGCMQDMGEIVPEPSRRDEIVVEAGTFAEYGKGVVKLVEVDLN
jgi:hypothetical protein